ncbi:galactosyl transferase GMA12/MNN10 family-domain-containing protein [Lipomyces orientalis]|uniref:Galactosyl transferase GMA12/MNN10 family-domain-containing protein n=1 Tax=Lipomyces orientalis TaxID=1233043 RepID=A0ACC3TW78_9ASCO
MKVTRKFQLIGAFALISIAALIYLSIPYARHLDDILPWKSHGGEVTVQEDAPVTVVVEQPQSESPVDESKSEATVDTDTPAKEQPQTESGDDENSTDAAIATPTDASEPTTESEQEKIDEATEEADAEALQQAYAEDRQARLAEIQGKAQDTLEPKGNKIVVLTATDGKGHNNEINNLFDMVTENREEYCAFHDYTYQFSNISQFQREGRIAVWNKIPAVQNAFDINPDAEWVWWLDMDIIIMTPLQDLASLVLNPDSMLEQIAYDAPIKLGNEKPSGVTVSRDVDPSKIDLIIAQDHAGVNAGSMLFRRSDWTFSFLDMWVDPVYVDRFRNEQDALSHIILQHEKIREHVGFVPQRVINAYSVGGNEMGWRDGDILVHFAGCWVDKKCNERWQDFWPRRTVVEVPLDNSAAAESVEANNEVDSAAAGPDGANGDEGDGEKKDDAAGEKKEEKEGDEKEEDTEDSEKKEDAPQEGEGSR